MKPFAMTLALSMLAPATVIVTAANAAPQSVQVTQQFILGLDGNAAYYTLVVPQAVYAASQRGDLGDLRIFNGAGELVPYSLDAPPPAAPTTQSHAARWFPLPSANAGASGGAPIGVSIAADGSLRATAIVPPRSKQHADLVDLSTIKNPIDALRIHLRDDSYDGRVQVDASNDLRDWQRLTETRLLKLNHDGSTLTQERIELGGIQQRYFRLTWPDGAPDIDSIDADVSSTTAPAGATPDRVWRDAVKIQAGAPSGTYEFETDGAYPVDSLRIGLPQPNTVARATIQSRPDAQAPWRNVAGGTLFRLSAGGASTEERVNPPLVFNADADRDWRIVVDTSTGGFGSGLPSVQIGWHPASVTFVARGAPPFSLGVGNAALASTAVSRDALQITGNTPIGAASIDHALPPTPLAPPATAPRDPDAQRRYLLWAALALAVGMLGTLAWRLARSPQS